MVKVKCLSYEIHLLKRGCNNDIAGTISWKHLFDDLKQNLLNTKGVEDTILSQIGVLKRLVEHRLNITKCIGDNKSEKNRCKDAKILKKTKN